MVTGERSRMARTFHPRRGPELRTVPPQPTRPVLDPAALMELRELVSDIAAQVGERRSDTQALAQTLASQAHKLDEITALQSVALRRLAEVDLDHRSRGPRRIAARLVSAARNVRRALTGRLRGPAGEETLPLATAPEKPLSWILAGAAPGEIERVVMVLLFGLTVEQQEIIVARLLDNQLPPGVAPLFVTDRTDFATFRARRAYFERVLLEARPDAAHWRDQDLYAARRFSLLCDKWKPLRVIAFGAAAAQQLDAWRGSPHVTPAVRDLLGGVGEP